MIKKFKEFIINLNDINHKLDCLQNKISELENSIKNLEIKNKYLYCMDIKKDTKIRDIISKINGIGDDRIFNNSIFDTKWENLTSGYYSLENEEHKKNILSILESKTGFESSWFKDKVVLDAGCGDGRLSYAFCLTGANTTSIDFSEKAIDRVKYYCSNFKNFVAFRHNLLEPLEMDKKFDFILSLGVLHHTGNTQLAFKNLVEKLKKGGYISIMIYGHPRYDVIGDFIYMNQQETYRNETKHLSFSECYDYLLSKVKDDALIRGWYDAIAPSIEDHYTFEEVALMIKNNNCKLIKVLDKNKNIVVLAQKNE